MTVARRPSLVHERRGVLVREGPPGDELWWRRAFAAYRATGGLEPDDAVLDRVWAWIADPAAQARCLTASMDDELVGLAHVQVFERPIAGATGLWIDDLFVEESARGHGVGRVLLEAARRLAGNEGHDVVRWTTREGNTGAVRLYDQLAVRAPVLVFNARPLGVDATDAWRP